MAASDDDHHRSPFEAVFEDAAIGVALVDMQGHPVRVNRALVRMLGYSAEELAEMVFTEFTHPEDAEADWDLFAELIRGDRDHYQMEKRYFRRDGRLIWGRLTVSLVRGSDGDPSFAIGMVEDVTERKRAEEALRERSQRLAVLHSIDREILSSRSLEDLVHVGLSHVRDLDPCDRASVALLVTADEAVMFGVDASNDTGLFEGARVPLRKDDGRIAKLRSGEPLIHEDLRDLENPPEALKVLRCEGLRTHASIPMTSNGELIGSLNLASKEPGAFTAEHLQVAREIADQLAIAITQVRLREEAQERASELERLVQELTTAEAKYRTLVEQLPAVVYLNATDGRSTALYVSPNYEELLGYTPEERLADPELWRRSLHPDDRTRVLEEAERAEEAGTPFSIDYRMIRKDGRVIWVHEEGRTIRHDPDGPLVWQGVLLDITDRKQAEEELLQATAALRASDHHRRELLVRLVDAQEQERRRVAADIHDDTIQSITAVGMRLGALRRYLQDDPEARSDFDELEATVSTSIGRLRNLLFDLHPRALDQPGGLRIVLREALGALAERSGLAARFEDQLVEEPSPHTASICYRIAHEALTNVRKHAGASKVNLSLETKDGGIHLRIWDDGVGIGSHDGFEEIPGHLGLASMKERAELAGGWWRLSGAPGRGTTVEFWVPA